MSIKNSESFAKFPVRDSENFLIVHSSWTEDNLKVEIVNLAQALDGSSKTLGWTGEIPISNFTESAEALEIPRDEFINENRLALDTNGGLKDFEYNIEADETFTIRKVDQVRVIYCKIPLVADSGIISQLLIASVDKNDAIRNELNAKQLEAQTIDMDFKMLVQSYEKVVSEKTKAENELMNKFVALLNAKKSKIAELQELLTEGKKISANSQSAHGECPSTSSRREEAQSDDVEMENTQPMSLAATQRPVRMLPKRKKHPEADDKRSKDDEVATTNQPTSSNLNAKEAAAESERSLNSEELFNAIS